MVLTPEQIGSKSLQNEQFKEYDFYRLQKVKQDARNRKEK